MNTDTLRTMGGHYHPLQSLEITFAPGIDGMRILSVLYNYYRGAGMVRFDNIALACAVLESQNWDRTGRKLLMSFHPSLWTDRSFPALAVLAERGIEQIRVAADSPLNALQSGREKKRTEAFGTIAAGVLPVELRDEIEGFGLTVEHYPLEFDGLHMMAIAVKNRLETVFSIFLDGWSGNILSPDLKVLSFCTSFGTAQEVLKKSLYEYLETSTA